MDDFGDITGIQNPILRIMHEEQNINPIFRIMQEEQNNIMGSHVTEEEIKKHKDKLNNLIYRLNNTHNIDEENSINNEIKKETEFLSSLFNIKRNELNQINNMNNIGNNNMNINNNLLNSPFNQNGMNRFNNDMNNNILNNNQMQQQMMQQQAMMQQQMAQQQMMQQQAMMQQQMLQQQAMMQQQALEERLLQIEVIFNQGRNMENSPKIKVQCSLKDKVSSMIEKYRNLSGDRNPNKKFIYNARKLNESLSLAEAGITNNSVVFVI